MTPNINHVEEKYFFEEMDENKDGMISLKEIRHQFEKHGISLISSSRGIPFPNITSEMEEKILHCFNRLYLILTKKNLTLNKVFEVFDKSKTGSLNFPEFTKIINKVEEGFADEELKLVFKLVDTDNSNSV